MGTAKHTLGSLSIENKNTPEGAGFFKGNKGAFFQLIPI
jgi:hypothetical protein